MARLDDPQHVSRQYADSSRLDARVRIYREFAQREDRLHDWLFERLALAQGTRVLDVGAGSGLLWTENAAEAARLRLTLGDLSPGMLDAARVRFAEHGLEADYRELDAQSLPFADGSFDAITANHMLYHVPDRGRALRDFRRVLVPGGRVHAVTNGWSHLFEIHALVQRFGIRSGFPAAASPPGWFDVEAAAREVAEHFADVRIESYRDALHVGDPDVLVDYVRSLIEGEEDRLEQLRRHVAWTIDVEGHFHVSTWVGLVTGIAS